MDPDVQKLAELFAVIGAFGGTMAIIGLVAHLVVERTRRARLLAARPPAEVDEARMARLEQAVEAIALELERVGEAQRFSERLLRERAAGQLPERAAEAPAPVPRRDEG